jgi:bacterioferritin
MTRADVPREEDMMTNPFELDLKAIRQRARTHMEQGPVTKANTSDREAVIKVLNDALATETICVMRYKRHAYAATGPMGEVCAEEFLEHATEEQQHADWFADRIDQLGGVPDLDPASVTKRSHTEYTVGETLKHLLSEDLVAERIAVETYTEIIRWLGERDPTTRRLFETVLAKEEEHADDLRKLIARLG